MNTRKWSKTKENSQKRFLERCNELRIDLDDKPKKVTKKKVVKKEPVVIKEESVKYVF